MIIVGQDFEKSIRRFRKDSEPILKELKTREGFLSKSRRRKEKDRQAEKRRKKMREMREGRRVCN